MPPRSKAQISKAHEALEPPATLLPGQIIARIEKALGHARYACLLPNKTTVIADLDERFRQAVWVERGNYVLLERYDPKEVEDDAVAKIINIAKDEKRWRKMSYWPVEFPKFQDPGSDDEDSRVGMMPPSDSEDDE
ncbi:related to eukaryotic translation initation factor eIF1a-like protein [Cephalotrichum gorgonifer]|uniref:Related to eukaryotic translation initation factor eIF1a-like protein n=1 Tax=Cephalotrichum gorgonifer TaxID=2041049 RepID=A0AAE8MUS8_9PEZI|nr:related to eukaryotic translation initation factor eIF1a-like protein [Cephalotrichum gorgonifer]